MDEIRELLDEVIKDDIDKISSLEAGSKEKSNAIDDVTKLYKLRLDEMKVENEAEASKNQFEAEQDKLTDEWRFKEVQLKEQNKDRWISFGLQIGLTIGGWIVYDIWHRRGLRFEEEGTITSPWTRNLISKMLPKK